MRNDNTREILGVDNVTKGCNKGRLVWFGHEDDTTTVGTTKRKTRAGIDGQSMDTCELLWSHNVMSMTYLTGDKLQQ